MKKQRSFQLLTNLVFVFIALATLNFIILVHEFGHWFFCHLFGVPTPLFSLGFGPKIIGKEYLQTFFQISLLPFGGYVEIDIPVFNQQPYAHQLLIMIAGIANNILLSLISFIGITWYNTQKSPLPTIEQISTHSEAQTLNLLPEDTLIAIDGTKIHASDFYKKLSNLDATQHHLTFERNNTLHEATILMSPDHNRLSGIIWHNSDQHPKTYRERIESITYAMQDQIARFNAFIKKNIEKNKRKVPIIGPLGIFTLIKNSIYSGLSNYILTIAFLSFNVAFFNLLPLPFFDGGKIMSYTMHHIMHENSSKKIVMLLMIIIVFLCITIRLYKKNKYKK